MQGVAGSGSSGSAGVHRSLAPLTLQGSPVQDLGDLSACVYSLGSLHSKPVQDLADLSVQSGLSLSLSGLSRLFFDKVARTHSEKTWGNLHHRLDVYSTAQASRSL